MNREPKTLGVEIDLPDVRREPESHRPTPGVVIAAATLIGVTWQACFEAFPHHQPFVHIAAVTALVILNRWARSE